MAQIVPAARRIGVRAGLYEEIAQHRLACLSPTVLADGLVGAARGAASLRVFDLGAGNGLMGEHLRDRGVGYFVGSDDIAAALWPRSPRGDRAPRNRGRAGVEGGAAGVWIAQLKRHWAFAACSRWPPDCGTTGPLDSPAATSPPTTTEHPPHTESVI